MMMFYIMLWSAITLSCIFIISCISYVLNKNICMNIIFVISAIFAFILWVGVLGVAIYNCSPKVKYEILLKDKIKVERNIEKHLIDNPKLREFEIDEYGYIKEIKEK